MKRFLTIIITTTLLIHTFTVAAFADSAYKPAAAPRKIMVYLKPDVTVRLNDVKLEFRDANKQTVYPVIYNGSTYLPIRAISSVMKEPVEWDSSCKTVFIGKTFTVPSQNLAAYDTGFAVEVSDSAITTAPKAGTVNAWLKPDVLIMYYFETQTFRDVDGNIIYPINYNGSTYLPIRAISALMKEPVEWDGATQTVLIGDGEEPAEESTVEEKNEPSPAAKSLKSLFDREEALYYEATSKTTNLKEASTLDDKQLLALAISDNYANAQKMTVEAQALDTSDFTDGELQVYDKTKAFIESTEYYILVLENIAYLAAQDMDYSMLADTFLQFAMDSQAKMEEARTSVQSINQ